LIAWAILFYPATLLAADDQSTICFDEPVAARMVVELERGRLLQEQIIQYAAAVKELEIQVEILKKAVVIQAQQLEMAQKTLQSYEEILEAERELCRKQIDAAKPSVLKSLMGTLGTVGIGVLLGVLLL